MNAYLNLKKVIDKIGKIRSVKLVYGKIDLYPVVDIKNRYELPHFEWLPHPLAIILDLFKDQNFKIKLKEKEKFTKIISKFKGVFNRKKINVEINFRLFKK